MKDIKDKIVYIVRHAKKQYDIGDVPLSLTGFKQAEGIGQYFIDKNIDLIISSPKKRVFQTAMCINKVIKVKFETNDLLRERIEYGENGINSYRDYSFYCAKSALDRDYILPNGESSIIAGKRFEKVIELIKKRKESIFLIVSHGGVIADFIRNCFNKRTIESFQNNFFDSFHIYSCSVTKIIIKENKLFLIDFNNWRYLRDHLKSITTVS